MKLFTPFTITTKANCDLCRITNDKKRGAEYPCLDRLFISLYRDRFDVVFD